VELGGAKLPPTGTWLLVAAPAGAAGVAGPRVVVCAFAGIETEYAAIKPTAATVPAIFPVRFFTACLSFVSKAMRVRFILPAFHARRRPAMIDTKNKTTKRMNRIFAMAAAVPAIPQKPSSPAINATIKKIMVHPNI